MKDKKKILNPSEINKRLKEAVSDRVEERVYKNLKLKK